MENISSLLTGLTIMFIGLFISFMPTLVAYSRKTKNRIPVMIINIFLGWTLIGWVIALAMAYSHEVEPKKVK
jgi:divalent metal cation (Fe/Co/Zn/Cd) transporter